jgi:hypothetical protein
MLAIGSVGVQIFGKVAHVGLRYCGQTITSRR